MKKNRSLIINICVISFIVLLLVATILVFTLVKAPSFSDSPKLSFYGLQFNSQTLTATAVVGFKIADTPEIQCDKVTRTDWDNRGFWFSNSYTEYKFNIQQVIASLNEIITDEDLITQDGTIYPRENLKYNFRFQTRYKSIKGGQKTSTDMGYMHTFILNPEDEYSSIVLYNKYPETANWYSILAVLGIAMMTIALFVASAILKNKDYNY